MRESKVKVKGLFFILNSQKLNNWEGQLAINPLCRQKGAQRKNYPREQERKSKEKEEKIDKIHPKTHLVYLGKKFNIQGQPPQIQITFKMADK